MFSLKKASLAITKKIVYILVEVNVENKRMLAKLDIDTAAGFEYNHIHENIYLPRKLAKAAEFQKRYPQRFASYATLRGMASIADHPFLCSIRSLSLIAGMFA